MRSLASLFNELGNISSNHNHDFPAAVFYKLATRLDSSWSPPWYNLGLLEKYRASWPESLRCNQQAALLNPTDEASWWNLGIAATALRNWPEARRAWDQCGIKLQNTQGEVKMEQSSACVRLAPQGAAEVVWGIRLDPARIRIQNIPFPDSGRRFSDIILNDGAQQGTRTNDGYDYPVLDELDIWQPSPYSTFNVTLRADEEAVSQLAELCEASDVAMEDHNSVRILCRTCSLGNPDTHVCSEAVETTGDRNFAFAATSREVLMDVLARWSAGTPATGHSDPTLELLASP